MIVNDFRQDGGFLRALRLPPPIILIYMKFVENAIKYNNPTLYLMNYIVRHTHDHKHIYKV